MTTASPPTGSPPPLLRDLLDDAAIFPPGEAPMAQAVPAHAVHVSAWYADLVGPFVCSGSRLPDLLDALDATPEVAALDVAVVLDRGTGSLHEVAGLVADDTRLLLAGVEMPLRGEAPADAARRAVATVDAVLGGPDDRRPVSIEVPWAPGWREALEVVAEAGHRAKLRTGGASAAAHPDEPALAERVLACLDLDVPFKLTAGLHHAVRRTEPDTSFEQHGFLNVLLAVGSALDGGGVDDVARVLADRDGPALAARAAALDEAGAGRLRRWFASFGTCSIAEPVEDLVALGLLTPGGPDGELPPGGPDGEVPE
ncbi:MAG TPA: hypothetical protein VK908_17700 [Jiangellales bacterium]|nr:hypothetical protein [Jiangellales bacterium]